jgi:hypothetical protein
MIPNTALRTGGAGIGSFTAAKTKPVIKPVTSDNTDWIKNWYMIFSPFIEFILTIPPAWLETHV